MAPEDPPTKKVGRKLKKRPPQRKSLELPERFMDGEDADEDVTAPKDKDTQYMNQSVFSMIAAAGSKTDFHARFDDNSSEDEGEQPDLLKDGQNDSSLKRTETLQGDKKVRGRLQKPERGTSCRKLLRPFPRPIHLNTAKESEGKVYPGIDEAPEHPTSLPDTIASDSPREAPIMSRMLEAQAQLQIREPVFEGQKDGRESPEDTLLDRPSDSLATRLMEIFDLGEPEEVISEYPCWLLQSVLLQGYMYITKRHICFYAYLPKKSNLVVKSGYLAKRGRQNPKYNRYWFTLKGDVLSYYSDPSDLYFPSGNIDLRYSISAALSEQKEKGTESTHFSVETRQRTYHFRADSAASAREWVKTLQKVIFRSHNDGDSVKISLPVENVIDIEDSPVVDFAETFKIRVVDNDETYAIDEYFFSFFSFGHEALNDLRNFAANSTSHKISVDLPSPQLDLHDDGSRRQSFHVLSREQESLTHNSLEASTPTLRENVRATLAPLSPCGSGAASPRASGEWTRSSIDRGRRSVDFARALSRASFDRERGSGSGSRSQSRDHPKAGCAVTKSHDSTDSFVHSPDHGPASPRANDSGDLDWGSASQILDRSTVFHSPTIDRTQYPPSSLIDNYSPRGCSQDGTRSLERRTSIRIHPPTRSQTQQSVPKTCQRQDESGDSELESEPCKAQSPIQSSHSTPTLQELVRAGAYPLQRAAGFAEYLKMRSKKMGSLLATGSMGYVEKVSGMWVGGGRHYGDPGGIMPDDQFEENEDGDDPEGHGERFRAHFALPSTERLEATFFGHLLRVLPLYGKIYVSNRKLCFRSLLPGTRTKMILPLKDVENVVKEKGFRFGYSGLAIIIRGHEELFFEFMKPGTRDDCAVTVLQSLESLRYIRESGVLSQEDRENADAAKAEHQMLQEARQHGHNEHEIKLPQSTNDIAPPAEAPPILFDDPRVSIINFKPTEVLRVTCLTIGSRGDVQPYIALCKGLMAEGHKPKIATHAEFGPWIRSHGIDFAPVDGDPAELMRICVDNGMFTYSFLREASVKFRGWIDELLSSAWIACQNTDLLIESPSAMAGIHIAEALDIPYFRAFTMPWTRTRAYPHAFAVPEHKMGGAYNYITYVMFDNVFWKAIAGQVNRWRKKELGLRSTSLDKMQPNKVPFLYNFSPCVVVPPLDYSDWIRVTGYWFLDETTDWEPPRQLTDFMTKAKRDGKKIVYIGFGSIVVPDTAALTRTIVDSVLKADVRCILSKGWSDRLGNKGTTKPEVPLPKEIYQIKSVPHDWLFQRIDAAAHHGGAGTTGASLRAGLPTIVKPFFGDQFFFGSRVEDLGVGIYIKKLNVSVLARALWEATHSERIIVKAKVLGEQIRKEDGVGTAIQALYRDLEYAKTLTKKTGSHPDHAHEDFEESWTFIGDESDPELAKCIKEWDPMARLGSVDRRGMPALGGKISQEVDMTESALP